MLDVSRAKERFGFVARVALDEGLGRTIAWYRAHGHAAATERDVKASE
jgi:GDP-L-fucose synthase